MPMNERSTQRESMQPELEIAMATRAAMKRT
jgi:hypothetical protein